jgi:hypothetical protein
MNDQRPPPPWVGDESALVLLDWSWWLNKAFRIGGLEGMTSNVVGWLCGLLAWRPAHLAIALDCNGDNTNDYWFFVTSFLWLAHIVLLLAYHIYCADWLVLSLCIIFSF